VFSHHFQSQEPLGQIDSDLKRSMCERVSAAEVRHVAELLAFSKWELQPTNLKVETVFALRLSFQ
jgi:hypothetical protein